MIESKENRTRGALEPCFPFSFSTRQPCAFMMRPSALLLQMKLLAELKVPTRNDDVSCKSFTVINRYWPPPRIVFQKRVCLGLKSSLYTSILIWNCGMDSRCSRHWEFCVLQALTLRVSLALLGLWPSWAWRADPFLGRWQKQLKGVLQS